MLAIKPITIKDIVNLSKTYELIRAAKYSLFIIFTAIIITPMKTWKQVSEKYPTFLNKKVKAPQRRLSALSKIEMYLNQQYPSILKGYTSFIHIDKFELRSKYEEWKGKNISGAESQVFNDFYKLYYL